MIVRHSHGSYPVRFCSIPDILDERQGIWLVDENVLAHWPEIAQREPIIVPSGETSKSLAEYGMLQRELAQRGVRRDAILVAVGGGVVGDLAGFVASTYLRGVPYLHVPTTLLAMVDSSVGGKVGIDLPEGKNLVGSFWPPIAVDVAVEFLTTLPPRQLTNGMAEVLKYGFIEDPEILALVKQPADPESQRLLIERCISIKASIVEEDEHDRLGRRAILNFGHSIGHAIEVVHSYDTYLHGEAISLGMVAEARLGEWLNITASGTADRVAAELVEAGLPVDYDGWANPELLGAMRLDKKNEGSGLAFSLISELGRCKLCTGIAEVDVKAFLNSL